MGWARSSRTKVNKVIVERFFPFIVGNFVFFLSFEACKNMSAKCAIEKLQKVAKEKET